MSVTATRLGFDTDRGITEVVAGFMETIAREAGLERRKAYWLRLAVEEITTNIVQHGYRGQGPVWLEGKISDCAVSVLIEDKAPAFDPRGHDCRERLSEDPSSREEGGFGLLLALRNLDGFSYEYADGKNRNELIMHRSTGDSDDGIDCAGHR
jgi:anti-sigma regulatory factor (Ser/Thr protein kinase)